MSPMDLLNLSLLTEEVTKKAGKLAQCARSTLKRELKPDGSIVTNADRETESFLRDELRTILPGATLWGEETGHASEGPEGLWLVDPIDGTSNYAFGSPLWGVSVAFSKNHELLTGAVVLPDLNLSFRGIVGGGAFKNGLRMPEIPRGLILDEELIGYAKGLELKFPETRWPGKMRHFGAFVVEAMFVAEQKLRGLIDYRCKLYDMAAALVVLKELGADIRYASGGTLDWYSLFSGKTVGRPFVVFPHGSGFYSEETNQ